jgi:histidine triad (HIT) family protein
MSDDDDDNKRGRAGTQGRDNTRGRAGTQGRDNTQGRAGTQGRDNTQGREERGKAAGTVFEDILSGTADADIVYEDDYVVAFREINPEAPIHVLVIPRTPMHDISQTPEHDPAVIGGLLQGIARTARALSLEENGYRVVFNVGRDALQTIPYLHGHILAGRTLGWPPG